jgi:hypothetical protein
MPSLVLAKKCYGVAVFDKIIAGDNRASYGKRWSMSDSGEKLKCRGYAYDNAPEISEILMLQ